MSIPPLVCSTPPPPDQCEDDKDPEDFELSYSLSQEDDDDDENGYNYGNFSSYNNFQSTPDNKPLEIKQQEILKNIESEVQNEIFLKYEDEKETELNNASGNMFRINDINENKLKCDEDLSIEDLNLKVDDEIDCAVDSNTEQIEINEGNIGSVKDLDIPNNSNNDSPNCENVTSSDENIIDATDELKEINTHFVQQVETQSNDEEILKEEPYVDNTEISVLQENISSFSNEDIVKDFESNSEENVLSDDFGDFDGFQSVNTKSYVTGVIESSNNPWENVEPSESDFKSFTANFEENEFQSIDDLTPTGSVFVTSSLHQPQSATGNLENNLEDDDFGDFDDFKSSSLKTESNEVVVEEPSQCQELPVLNLQSTESEHQIMESISKVLSSVFLEEITEPEDGFESKLESLLSETWGHLMETDERQPYIVNWNNSLGQKTLLKALCIDSRNILFGPKWNSNMPKYAANLSNAPLQPQKQAFVPSSIVPQNETVTEKSSSKPTTWTDPFTSDGQEFTYAEALLLDLEHLMATLDQMAHNHSTLKISELLTHACNTENESATTPGPTDLDVFEAAISSKSDKIYSNTLGVQPLRQINLPDTHIFTPTDSEIPRSKTIHYDSGPTLLLPQTAVVDDKSQTDTVYISNTKSVSEKGIDDNEYWEFQNFKSSSDTNSLPGSNSQPQVTTQENNFSTATTVIALPKPNIAYQTDLLQPIKVEPSMPSLNWPDPGEVKGVFDDFSNFISISSQSTETQDSSANQPGEIHSGTGIFIPQNVNAPSDNIEAVTDATKPDNGGFDDDFDTFQSALPTKGTSDNLKSQISSKQITELSYGSPKFDSIKSDTISFPSILRPNEALTQNIGYISNATELTNKSSLPSGTQNQTNLLQPTPASFSSVNTQKKSCQILHPMSLESYSQINWPSPGIDLQDLSRFNPVETLHSLKSDLSVSGHNKGASPVHVANKNTIVNQVPDDDVWGDFVSSKPKQQQFQPKKPSVLVDDDEWTDFISSPSVKPQNGLNTISLNVHTNSNIQKSVHNKFGKKGNQPLDIPTLNYITPKSNPHKSYNDKHFQNL